MVLSKTFIHDKSIGPSNIFIDLVLVVVGFLRDNIENGKIYLNSNYSISIDFHTKSFKVCCKAFLNLITFYCVNVR